MAETSEGFLMKRNQSENVICNTSKNAEGLDFKISLTPAIKMGVIRGVCGLIKMLKCSVSQNVSKHKTVE